MLPIRTILHPTDFSDSCRPAFDFACALARDYGAELIVAHAIAPTRVFAPDGIAVPFPEEDHLDVHARLARLQPADRSVEIDYRVVEEEPAEGILNLAERTHADVIVMGTHGSGGLMRLLMGSVAESVMRKAPCPVLTVRGPFRTSPVASDPVAGPVGVPAS